MLADLRAAWRLRSGQAGPGRLAFLTLLIVLAGATDGVGLALLVPLLNSLGATDVSAQSGLFAFLPRTLGGLLLAFLCVVLVRALVSRMRQMVTARLSFDFAVALRVRAYAAIAHASWSYLQRQRTADFHALFSTEIERVEHATHLLLEAPARLSILAAHFVVAFAIAPGFTLTEASRAAIPDAENYGVGRGAIHRASRPADVVGACLWLASPLSDFVTGQTVIVDGGRQFI